MGVRTLNISRYLNHKLYKDAGLSIHVMNFTAFISATKYWYTSWRNKKTHIFIVQNSITILEIAILSYVFERTFLLLCQITMVPVHLPLIIPLNLVLSCLLCLTRDVNETVITIWTHKRQSTLQQEQCCTVQYHYLVPRKITSGQFGL